MQRCDHCYNNARLRSALNAWDVIGDCEISCTSGVAIIAEDEQSTTAYGSGSECHFGNTVLVAMQHIYFSVYAIYCIMKHCERLQSYPFRSRAQIACAGLSQEACAYLDTHN